MKNSRPIIGIIMGSDSDLPVMNDAAEICREFKIPHEVTVVSAHRTPDRMVAYAKSAASRGLKVLIAGAGGSAHLPGMTASLTTLPVIGVPVKTKSLAGLDSLLSIVQMPAGIPVATVAINGAKNAGLLAVKIIAAGDSKLTAALQKYMNSLKTKVSSTAKELETVGTQKYMRKHNLI